MGSTSYNSGYEVSLPLVASPKLLPEVATSHIRKRYMKFRTPPLKNTKYFNKGRSITISI